VAVPRELLWLIRLSDQGLFLLGKVKMTNTPQGGTGKSDRVSGV